MNFYIGMRVRRNCQNCDRIFQTQKIDPAGNEKNKYCANCKREMKIQQMRKKQRLNKK